MTYNNKKIWLEKYNSLLQFLNKFHTFPSEIENPELFDFLLIEKRVLKEGKKQEDGSLELEGRILTSEQAEKLRELDMLYQEYLIRSKRRNEILVNAIGLQKIVTSFVEKVAVFDIDSDIDNNLSALNELMEIQNEITAQNSDLGKALCDCCASYSLEAFNESTKEYLDENILKLKK